MSRHLGAVENIEQLEDLLSEPTPGAVEAMARMEGDLLLLGVGGKMGPTLARMAHRASAQGGRRRKILGVSRFSEPGLEASLRTQGIETISCDLLDPAQVALLPEVPNVIFMAGMKFGTTGQASRTWAMNVHAPAIVCEKFRKSRLVAFSTGNVYGLAPVSQGGSVETDPLNPVGEYSLTAVGRERIFEHFSRTHRIPLALLRLNYACELRYGVLVDLAWKVYNGQPIDLAMGHLNAIWQGDANAMTLQAFDHAASPPVVLNLAGPETLSVRRVALQLGELLERPVKLEGSEAPDALLSNAQLSHQLFGYPRVPARQLLAWVADWVKRGGASLGKPTHFEARDGAF